MGESQTMVWRSPPRLDLCSTLPNLRTEPCGPPPPVVCGNSTSLTGSSSDLNPTYPPDPSVKRDLIMTERFGFYRERLSELRRRSLLIFEREAISSKRSRLTLPATLPWTPMDGS